MQHVRIVLALLSIMLLPHVSLAQNARRANVTGRVTDAVSGQPVSNATVQIVGTTFTALTGADGHYAISGAPVGVYDIQARLDASGNTHVENIRLRAGTESVVNLVMSRNLLRLAERVTSASVVPMSALRAPFAVDKVTAQHIPVPTISSPGLELEGKVAGLTLQRASGAPGADVSVQLRSAVSVSRSTEPLYVVDGVMLSAGFPMTAQDIETLDITSIEVIKGAAATTLYGFRGANGVISVTTNRGQALALGQTQFTVRNEAGWEYNRGWFDAPLAHPFRVNATGQYVNAAGVVVPRSKRVMQANGIAENRYVDPVYNHGDEFFQSGLVNTQSITIGHNRATTNFNVSYARSHQPGTVPNADGYSRQSVRLNVDQRWRDRLQVGLSVSHTLGREEPAQADFFGLARLNADASLLAPDPTGKSRFLYQPDSAASFVANPLALQLMTADHIRRTRTLANVTASFRVFSWLTVEGLGSSDRGRRNEVMRPTSENSTANIGAEPYPVHSISDTTELTQIQGGLTARKAFGALTAQLSARGESQRQNRQSHGSVDAGTVVINGVTFPLGSSTSSWSKNPVKAGLANLGLDYAGKYVADVAFRREDIPFGSRDNNKRYSHSRGSVAWLLSEEGWFPFDRFNLLKLRYSVGRAATLIDPNLGFISVPIGSVPPVFKPGTVTEREIGLDLIMNNRVQATFTYASVKSLEASLRAEIPTAILADVGLKGHTVEGTIQAHVLNNQNGLQWHVLLVGDHRQNRIKQWNGGCEFTGSRFYCENTNLNTMWGHQILRDKNKMPSFSPAAIAAFDINDEGYVVPVGSGNTWRDGKAKNLWGTVVNIDGYQFPWGLPIAQQDIRSNPESMEIGDATPKLRYGFQNSFRYKGFRLYSQIAGQFGGQFFNRAEFTRYRLGFHSDVAQADKSDELRKPIAYYRAIAGGFGNAFVKDFVESATTARLSEASIGYEFNANKFGILKRVGAKRIQVDLVGRNLFTLMGYSGLERPGTELGPLQNPIVYPQTRTFTLATALTF